MSQAFVTQAAPSFTCDALVPGGEFAQIKLEQYKGKYVVLFFYPHDFTFVCPTEIIAFNDRASEFAALNCVVLGASVDSKYSHHAWASQKRSAGGIGPMNELKIPLIADTTHVLSKSYGAYLESAGHTLRGLYIIDDHGILVHSTQNAPQVGRSVDETLRLVEAYQHAAVHGEVCPAGWSKTNKTTIKTTPTAKLEFFEKTAAETKQ